MACIRKQVFAGKGNSDAAGGGEAELIWGTQRIVKPKQNLSRVVRRFAPQGAKYKSDAHGGRHSLPETSPTIHSDLCETTLSRRSSEHTVSDHTSPA